MCAARTIGTRGPLALFALILTLIFTLTACGEDGLVLPDPSSTIGDQPTEQPPVEETPEDTLVQEPPVEESSTAPTTAEPLPESTTTAPPATEAPATEAPTTEQLVAPPPETPADTAAPPATIDPSADDDSADDNSGPGLFLFFAIGALVIAGVGFLLARIFSGPPPVVREEAPDPLPELLGNLRWLHDQLSLELLSAPPARATDRWAIERPRLDRMTIACQERASNHGTADPWRQIASTVSNLGQSLDTAVISRADPSIDPTVTHEAIEVVNENRARLQIQLEQVDRSGVA